MFKYNRPYSINGGIKRTGEEVQNKLGKGGSLLYESNILIFVKTKVIKVTITVL